MNRFSHIFATVILVSFVFQQGCDRGAAVPEVVEDKVRGKVRFEESDEFKALEQTPYETNKLAAIHSLIDVENKVAALREARALVGMHPSQTTILELIDLYSWIGKSALPDLQRLMATNDAVIANAAFANWEVLLKEINSSSGRIQCILNTVEVLNDQSLMDSVMLHLVEEDPARVKGALDRMIKRNRGSRCWRCGVEAYEHIFGEKWIYKEEKADEK